MSHMKIISKPDALRAALMNVKPEYVAVAFLGAGWDTYIDTSAIREIIVSPTLGTNPRALDDVIDRLGIDNVHFLDNLHAKLYLGKRMALLGSANLTDNGFADNRQKELCGITSDKSIIEQFRKIYGDWKEQAKTQYPTTGHKVRKLRKLMSLWSRAISAGVLYDLYKSVRPKQYRSQLDRIHVAWYFDDVKYNEKVISTKFPGADDVDSIFDDAMSFVVSDNVREGDWILWWQAKEGGVAPVDGGEIGWMYVHHVIPNGAMDKVYTQLVASSATLKSPPPPFLIGNDAKKKIYSMLLSGDFGELLGRKGEVWKLSVADGDVKRFLKKLTE